MCGAIERTSGHKIRKDMTLKFYKSKAPPYLMYDSETWTLRRPDDRRPEAAEMRFLRCVAGYTLWDKGSSDGLRSQLGMKKLDKQIRERKTNWLELLQRMPSERAPKVRLYCQPIGRRDPGRPGKRCLDV
jgi:hypothetical protein